MTDLAGVQRRRPAASQRPVGWYIDPTVRAMEEHLIFDTGPRYIGHGLMVPEPGDYRLPETARGADILVRNTGGVELLTWRQGRDDVGPYHAPYEDAMQHFHAFVQRQLHGS